MDDAELNDSNIKEKQSPPAIEEDLKTSHTDETTQNSDESKIEKQDENLEDSSIDPEVESSVDALGLLSEAVSRDRNYSDDDLDADDEEARTPDSMPDQQEESGDAAEEGDAIGQAEYDEEGDPEQDDDIDINDDFELNYESGDERLNVDQTIIEKSSESPTNKSEKSLEAFTLNDETAIVTDVVSLAASEISESEINKTTESNIQSCIEKSDACAEMQLEIDSLAKENVSQEPHSDETHIKESNVEKSDETESDVQSSTDIADAESKSESKKSKLSDGILKGLREEAHRISVGKVSQEDLDDLKKELQDAMKTIFGETICEAKSKTEKKKLNTSSQSTTVPTVSEATSIDVIDLSDDDKDAPSSNFDNTSSNKTTSGITRAEKDKNIDGKRSKKSFEDMATMTKTKPTDITYVDLDESSSDSEDKAKSGDKATTVRIPSSIEVISSSTTNNSKISCTGDSGVSVISGLPMSSAKQAGMRINTAEITISTVNKNAENDSLLKPVEVFNLDSDEEETVKQSNTGAAKEPLEIMDVDSVETVKKSSVCINPSCKGVSDDPLISCPIFILGMYNIKRTKKENHPQVCKDCFDEVINETEHLVWKFKSNKPLITTTSPTHEELVEILDSDSEDDDKNEEFIPLPGYDPLPDEELEFVTENLPDVMEEVCQKYKFDEQINLCNKLFNDNVQQLQDYTTELEREIKELEENTNRIRNTLYENIKIPRTFLTELIIPSEFDVDPKIVEINDDDKRLRLARNLDSLYNTPNDVLSKLPPPGPYTLPPLEVGSKIYTVKHSIFAAWVEATVVDISPLGTPMANGLPLVFSLLTVRFSSNLNQNLKQASGRQIAYSEPAKVRYPIGTRVIALFKDNTATMKKDAYYSGVIAESPTQLNKFRYLVFFDDGYSQYIYHKHILPISERSSKVWDDVHPDSRDFVKKYLINYPERPMVRMEVGQTLKTEKSGSWWEAKVLDLDASLALLQFVGTNKQEWIYRGSTRIYLLYHQLQAADRRALAPGRHRPSGTIASRPTSKLLNTPYVEYTRPQDQEVISVAREEAAPENEKLSRPQRAVAKKSTSSLASSTVLSNVPKIKEEDQTPEVMEPAGNMVKSRVVYYSPKVWVHPEKITSHECGPQCLNSKIIPLSNLRSYNPLTRPLLSAWERLIIKSKYKRIIMYRAPCGRRLRNIQEVHKYLLITGSDMSVDLFDFDFRVHCLAEFVLMKCFVSKGDISHGVEAVPVPCVNYYDNSLPEFWCYSTKRQPTKGVDLNIDEEFLCACDCTDDCRNKETCQCWQLTYEGTRFIGMRDEDVGYQYKRLHDQVPTGIYECNSRCKCAATCLNRVVQHPLQLKLQVFKTYNKGWGIRALNDIPKGSFICIYAGSLLTDAVANVDGGINEGDKYLADLDYIEVVERLKENYEADVPDADKALDRSEDQQSEDETDNDDDEDEDVNPEHLSKYASDEEVNFSFIANTDPTKAIKTRLRTRLMQDEKIKSKNKELDSSSTENSSTCKDSPNDSENKVPATKDDGDKTKDVVNEDLITISDDEEAPAREPSRFAAPEGVDNDEYVSRYKSVRSFYGSDEACFIMDARVRGNIGRYLNHSCSPNVYVQNVFVDTHDPRFPWVAFFALVHVRAGTELTWNYNYDIGSVPGKVIYCRCGAPNCRGRLL
ncbi:SET domain bifurcated histone lysine methyltransferase eggless [Arctopsyche grandis]|uniref:SET domain bifurcated histone lysine methyltransferase eggless n=1 Tax=Arctopsyche grandis TaxID=121162 RepID=UPI00406D9BE8